METELIITVTHSNRPLLMNTRGGGASFDLRLWECIFHDNFSVRGGKGLTNLCPMY